MIYSFSFPNHLSTNNEKVSILLLKFYKRQKGITVRWMPLLDCRVITCLRDRMPLSFSSCISRRLCLYICMQCRCVGWLHLIVRAHHSCMSKLFGPWDAMTNKGDRKGRFRLAVLFPPLEWEVTIVNRRDEMRLTSFTVEWRVRSWRLNRWRLEDRQETKYGVVTQARRKKEKKKGQGSV
jgi:hypothetical protein